MILEVSDFVTHLLDDDRLWWAAVSALYFVIAVYSALAPRREYPWWFWLTYLLISASILLHISVSFRWEEPITTMAEFSLLFAAALAGVLFFKVISVYAANKEQIDDVIRDVREK